MWRTSKTIVEYFVGIIEKLLSISLSELTKKKKRYESQRVLVKTLYVNASTNHKADLTKKKTI